MVNFGWHRLTRIRLIKFTLKYQLQKACVSNISSTGQSGRGLPRNLFHFSRSLSGWDLLNDALKGMSLFTTFYYWWEPIWSLLCCARGAASPGDWWTELEGIRVVQARAPWDNSTRGKKKKRLFFTFHCLLLLSFTFPILPHPSSWTARFSGLLLRIKRERAEKAEGLRGAAGGTCRKSCQLLWVAMIFCFIIIYDGD